MHIVVNGEDRNFSVRLTVLGLIEELGLVPEAIVTERNGEIVKRTDYADTVLTDGDTIELIQFVGGG